MALPENPIRLGPNDLINRTADADATGTINFDLERGNPATIGAFLDTNPMFHSSACGPSCGATPISGPFFSQVTLFRFTISLPVEAFLSVTHDDGVSLFPAGLEMTSADCPLVAAGVTGPRTDNTLMELNAGLYDLWYEETGAKADPLPAVLLQTTEVPEPASLALLASGLVGLGWLGRRRRRAA